MIDLNKGFFELERCQLAAQNFVLRTVALALRSELFYGAHQGSVAACARAVAQGVGSELAADA